MNSQLKLAVLRFLLCAAATMGIGFTVYGPQIFDQGLTYFQVITFGTIVAGYITAIPLLGNRWLILLVFVSYLGVAISAGSDTLARLLRDAVWVLLAFAGARACLWSNCIAPSLRVGKFVVWAAIFAATNLAALYLIATIQSVSINSAIPPVVASLGAIVGSGAGLGFELSALVAERMWYSEQDAIAGHTG